MADLHLTPAQACRAGSCADICNILISTCGRALYADGALKHDLLSVMIGQLVERTNLGKHLREAGSFCRGDLKNAMLVAQTMFDGENWKTLRLDKHFGAHWHDRRRVLQELNHEALAIPDCIYKRDSPALHGFEFPSWKIT